MKLNKKNIKEMSAEELETISGGLKRASDNATATATATASARSSAEAEAEAEAGA